MFDLFSILSGAFLYRWRGMDHDKKEWFPRPFNQILFAFPYAFITYLYYCDEQVFTALIFGGVVWFLTSLAVLTGHGRGHDLGDTDEGEPETLEFLIDWLKPHVPLYWYDMALLSVKGLAITLPAGLLTMNPALALSGSLVGPAYGVAKFGRTGTNGGELLAGAVLWGCL